MRRLRDWVGVVVVAASLSGAAARSEPIQAVAHLQVFGAMLRQHDRDVASGGLYGALAEISWRNAGIGSEHPLTSLHAIVPAARFRLVAPLVVPEVLIDAVTIGDPQALKHALQSIGLLALFGVLLASRRRANGTLA
jgi:hypothetical protein